MAIYHLSVSAVSRSTGRSAVAAAAYRAGACLRDERTGLVHDYRRRSGVLSAEIVAPPGCLPFDRERLWQAAEAAEKRKDARTAREIRIALPAELDAPAAQALARQFGQWLAERYRTVVDVAVHAPARGGDERNVHAHILMPTREIGADGTFGAKLRVLHDPKTGPAEIEAMRAAWEELANAALAAANIDARIDHRSLAAQGIDRAPSVHLGPAATHYERRTGQVSQIRERAEESARRAEQERAAILDEQQAAAERVVRLRERLKEARQILAAEREARRPSVVVRRAWSWVQQAAETSARAAAKATVEAATVVAGAAATLTKRAAAMTKAAGAAWRERMRRRQAEITRAKAAAARPAPRPAVRRAEERARVDEATREQARRVDLVRWCAAQGLTVEPDGRDHWKVRGPGGAGVCRITQRPGERPVWVAWDGGGGGDAISLVQHLRPGTSYSDAVAALIGSLPPPMPARSSAPEPARPTRPVLPAEADREAGRAYLASRGVDDATIRAAERAGALSYTRGAVLLVSRDERGEPRHVLRRGYRDDDPYPKRALAGSDTAFPVVLRGDPSRVVVVEGPITGLAAHSLARLRGDPPPTVIVTGGVAMRRWVRGATDLLRAAERVEIAAEREADPERQAATDAARERLAAAIESVTGRAPRITWPAPGAGDLADELAARRAEERRQAEEEERRRLEEERRRQAEEQRRRRDEEERRRREAEAEFLWQVEQQAIRRAEAAARRRQEEERRRAPEMRRAEERRRQVDERSTAEARRAVILQEEMKAAAQQLAQARTSWEREAVETAARMRAADRWRAEGIAPQEPRYSRRRQIEEDWEPPVPRM